MALVTSNYLKKILSIFPNNYCFAFAYGSAVFRQSSDRSSLNAAGANLPPSSLSGSTIKKDVNMIDMILVVDDSMEFHANNMKLNKAHYSMLSCLGAKGVSHLQDNFGARVYFNSLIAIKDENGTDKLLKYGVINRKNLINDLLDWDTLYISGRLHKPVKIINPPTDDGSLAKALSINHQNALYASLLLLSETFTEEQLYTTIANLSYSGDFRMIFGEDKNKVTKIVVPNIEKFRSIYQPYIGSSIDKGLLTFNNNQRIYFQDLSSRVIFHNLSLLPKTVQQNLYLNFETKGKLRDLDDVLMAIAQSYQYSDYVRNAISKIVWKSSWSQSLKGILTAGIIKSIRYSSRKVMKMRNS